VLNPLKKSKIPIDAEMEQKMYKWIADIDDGISKIGIDIKHLKV
jgi:hypothetical protein